MRYPNAALLAALAVTACAGPTVRGEASGSTAPPMDLAGEFDSTIAYLLSRHDADCDGVITRGEYDRGDVAFGRLDRDEDGRISAADWEVGGGGGRGSIGRRPRAPEEGVAAPDFTLAPPDGGEPVTLSDFVGTRPVALIFGSYT